MNPPKPSAQPDRLIMVYNANDGLFNAINDWAHKFFSPETYDCRLCHFTYGLSGMLRPWKEFLEAQAFPTMFYHRPDFRRAFPEFATLPLPLILVERAGQAEILLTAIEIGETGGLDPLIARVQDRLNAWSTAHP
jgi:predicted Zn-dependent protease